MGRASKFTSLKKENEKRFVFAKMRGQCRGKCQFARATFYKMSTFCQIHFSIITFLKLNEYKQTVFGFEERKPYYIKVNK